MYSLYVSCLENKAPHFYLRCKGKHFIYKQHIFCLKIKKKFFIKIFRLKLLAYILLFCFLRIAK